MALVAGRDYLRPYREFVDVVAPGSTVRTDGWGGYADLRKHGYTRQKTVLSSSHDPAHVSMPGVHRVASLLKRWILGTHQGARPGDLRDVGGGGANRLPPYLQFDELGRFDAIYIRRDL